MDRSLGQTVVSPDAEPTALPKSKKSSRLWLGIKLCLLVCVLMFLAEAGRMFLGYNFRTVIDGKCYRSAQPTERFLEEVQRTHGIRSILNLRDENLDQAWYHEEKQAAERLGIKLVNAGLSSSEQPQDFEFRRFVDGMDACEQPVLIHCASGNDRSGLASAVYLMLYTKSSVADARNHLSLRYGHISWGKAGCLQRILDSYELWLLENGHTHRADYFRHWAKHEYRPESL